MLRILHKIFIFFLLTVCALSCFFIEIFCQNLLIVVLVQDGRDREYHLPKWSGSLKFTKKWVCNVSIQRIYKNFWIFGQKCGKNMRKFIVASIPPGRGDQLMPLFGA